MYANLATAAPHIAPSQIPNFFKDATFGVPAGQVASSESPEPGVTIERDKSFGVPHIYGDTRAELMFGIGYASAEDRLFFIDALRHAGEGDLAQFAGGANASMDAQVWASEPYTQQDLVNQVQYGLAHSKDGPQILSDATNYVAGINAYIAKAQNPLFTGTMMPAEYLALGMSGPQPFSGRGPRQDRDAGRRDLRQRRRRAAVKRRPLSGPQEEVRQGAAPDGGVSGAQAQGRLGVGEVQGHVWLRHVPQLR